MSNKPKKKAAPKLKTLKLDLGCGRSKKAGFVGVDSKKEFKPDVVLDLRKDWPWKPNSIDEVHCSMLLQYLTGPERIEFFNKLHTVMVPGAQANIFVPHGQSINAWYDQFSCWPPIVEASFPFLNKEWREKNDIARDEITCDFDFGYGHMFNGNWGSKHDEHKNFALVHHWNTASVLQIVLTKR